MSTEKLSLSSPTIRSRIKKYDRYHDRGRIKPRKTVQVNAASGLFNLPNKNYNFTSAHTEPKITSRISSFKNRPKNIKTNNSKINTLALKSVSESQIYDNEVYPDNEITMYASAKRKLSILQKTMYVFGVLVLVISATVSIQTFINNNYTKDQIATLGVNSTKDDQGVTEGTGSEPSEEEISNSTIASYRISNPIDPKIVRIPEIGVIARVKNLGVTQDGAVDAPKNIYDAGWYNGSARPGNSVGSSLILGHVSGWTAPGIFKNINRLVPGSQFEVEKGNGEIVRYSVTKSEQIPLDQVDMSKILGTEVAGQHDIKLMTCSGKYNPETKGFDDRFVVYASQIK